MPPPPPQQGEAGDSGSESDPDDNNMDHRRHHSGSPAVHSHANEKNVNVAIDEWISFRVDTEAAYFGLQLRQKWHSLFIRRMRAPAKPWSQVDEVRMWNINLDSNDRMRILFKISRTF